MYMYKCLSDHSRDVIRMIGTPDTPAILPMLQPCVFEYLWIGQIRVRVRVRVRVRLCI